ncbi:MAG: helix-hairpin-helix domain-containing protein [Balneolaceae bacterium]|jgi:competence ComEA-like helix-hairpin-helix protein
MILVYFVPMIAIAQQQDTTQSEVQEDLEQALEVFDPQNIEVNTEQLTQYLQELAAHPVNINDAGTNTLLKVPGFSIRTAKAVIQYRSEEKPFESVGELTEVPGIGRVTLEEAKPYITVGRGLDLGKTLYTDPAYWTSEGHLQAFSRYQQDLQKAKGYEEAPQDGGYAGSRIKYYQRLGYRSDHLSLNITQQKDAGEQLIAPNKFDHQSYHAAIRDNGKLQMLVGGDYSLSFGQGMVLWSGASFGKGSDVINTVNRNGHGIHPYTSAQETNYYRGAAFTYGGKLQLTGFYSHRPRSASIISEDTTRFPGTDGYHRTDTEIRQKDDLNQTLYGGHVQMELPFGIVGVTGYKTIFDKYIAANNRTYARYDFEGRSNSAYGLDYSFLFGPAMVFGEIGRSGNGGMGFISGLESAIGKNTEMTAAYRKYQKKFQSILGNGFGEGSGNPKNENGVYLGIRHTFNERISASAYLDQYRFPGARFGTHQPTQGYDWLGKLEFKLAAGLDFYLQFRSKTEEEEFETTDAFGRKLQKLGEAKRNSLRANMKYWVNPKVRIRTRGELVRNKQAGEDTELGYLVYQGLRLLVQDNLRIDARLAMFDTESYATRVYEFENDLLYVFASQALYGRGQRMYALVNYEPFDFLELWGKFGITMYEDRQVIGSGLNEIRGDHRSEVGVEARIKF